MKLVRLISLFLLLASSAVQGKSEAEFHVYLDQLKQEAIEKGFDANWLGPVFADIQYRPTVIKSDKNQPERKITLDKYLATRVPDWKVKQAVQQLNEHQALLSEIGAKYGVQPRFIVALWGNESNFGKIQGKHPVLSALSSLAYEGRRETMFKKNFFAALTILQEGHASPSVFNGSWAGAMGQSQFMPATFMQYAVDYDGDGRKDIWSTPADVFASIANFLSSEGWTNKGTWGRQVSLVVPANKIDSGLKKSPQKPLSFWHRVGVRRYDGSDLPRVDVKASLIMPDGEDGRIYLVYNNFYTLMKWNRSSYFGISVGYLADRIKKGH